MKWPAHIPAGTLYHEPVIALDILPTAVAAAGRRLSVPQAIDGVNLLPYVTGKQKGSPHETLFWRMGANKAMRSRNWKLVQLGDQPAELYDLAADIGEANNLAAAKPDVVKRLTKPLADWESQLVQPVWGRPAGAARPARAQRRRRAAEAQAP
jgi:arylsulfatase A-like enzyme